MKGILTYHHAGELPDCIYCGKRMPYWIPGLPDSEHIHDKCLIEQFADRIRELQKQWDADMKKSWGTWGGKS